MCYAHRLFDKRWRRGASAPKILDSTPKRPPSSRATRESRGRLAYGVRRGQSPGGERNAPPPHSFPRQDVEYSPTPFLSPAGLGRGSVRRGGASGEDAQLS